jgi:hypothetical protein
MKRPILLLALIVMLAPGSLLARRRTSAPPLFPPCTVVNGTPGVTFTRDDGRNLAAVAQPLSGVGYTYGLAALDTPGVLLSWHKSTLSQSADHGCTWTPLGDFATSFPPRLVAAAGGRAYAWSDQRRFFLRFDARGAVEVKSPGELIGAGSDPDDGTHVRVVDNIGIVWESRDSGDTWSRIGALSDAPAILYRAAFDPRDLDHIVLGSGGSGAFVTRDGGRTWQQSSLGRGTLVYELVVSPADGNTVWAEGLEDIRHIDLSRDGGVTFRAVLDDSAAVPLRNGNLLAAHPTNPNVLYFVFGMHFQNYGTDLFRYDAARNALTLTHNAYDDIKAIAFSRRDPQVMYLGLANEPTQ